MDKKLAKVINDANKRLKDQKIFKNYEIVVDGDFSTEINKVQLTSKKGRFFPIANVGTVGEAIAVINGYMTGLAHGKDSSYPKLCDKNNS